MIIKSIFNKEDNKELVERINELTPESITEWCKMNVDQMFAHCQVPLNVASGELKLKRGLLGILFGGIAKKN